MRLLFVTGINWRRANRTHATREQDVLAEGVSETYSHAPLPRSRVAVSLNGYTTEAGLAQS
jgi:hypothetical protein